ncbi:radical SAM protein [candidate division KSB1 bacterium]|nr:radical SAM protein [candidate division KSB1 bacterium]MBL7094562.1 radical SAM protein [candidate division KSB1 bacterium]
MKVNEIFYSIQGESTFAGLPCVFVRLTGCILRCSYCDTKYAYEEGEEKSIDEIIKIVNSYNCNLVEITGGEPLLQSETVELTNKLVENQKVVLVETNGSLDISVLKEPVVRIVDIKCPGSKEHQKMFWDNLRNLRPDDNVKFVLTDRYDFDWALIIVEKFELLDKANVLFSPAFKILEPEKLSNWILKTSLPIRMQLQLHKYIWHPNKRGV